MKKFLILAISLIAVSNAWASRCGGEEIAINYYLFSPFEKPEEKNPGIYCDFWSQYAGAPVSSGDLSGLKWITDMESTSNAIVAAAKSKGDSEMLQYITDLVAYLRNNDDKYNQWRYPTQDELQQISDNYRSLLAKASAYKGTRLKDRYTLMSMRCLFQLERYAEVEDLWKSAGQSASDSDCRSTMMGLYAGALYNSKKVDQAAEIFMQLGDRQSLKYCLDSKRNAAGIKELYSKDPNSPMLMFLIEDFVNMYQENMDGDQLVSDYYSISENEARQFISLADQAIASGSTKEPMLWAEAAALLSSYLGHDDQASAYIAKCEKMKGSQRLKDNLRIIKFFQFVKTEGPRNSPDYMVQELKWLGDMAQKCEFHANANSRIRNLIGDKLQGDFNMEFLFYPAYNSLFEASADQVIKLREFLKSPKKMDSFQKYLYDNMVMRPDEGDFNDVLGTRYIGSMDFAKAIECLSKVKPDHYSDFCIGNLMVNRSLSSPAWDRQPDPVDDCPPTQLVTKNMKLEYCKLIMDIEAQYKAASGDDKRALAYQLAVMYHNATHWGGCWYLTHYYWSVYDEPDDIYTAFENKALKYLTEAAESGDGRVKSKALYAKTWMLWHNYEYFHSWEMPGEITPEMKQSMDALCGYWDSEHGYGEWTMPCDFVMDYARAR